MLGGLIHEYRWAALFGLLNPSLAGEFGNDRGSGEPLDEKPAETYRALGLWHRDSSSGSVQQCNPRFDSP